MLTTEPGDLNLPWGATFNTNGFQVIRGTRFNLKLTPERAEGVLAGYIDIEAFIHHLNTSWGAHNHSYGQLSSPSLYRALRRLADGYPDPKTGNMNGISGAVDVKFVQAYIDHPPSQTAAAQTNRAICRTENLSNFVPLLSVAFKAER